MRTLILAVVCSCAAAGVIPAPTSLEIRPGTFVLRPGASVYVPTGDADAKKIAEYLAERIAGPTGIRLAVAETRRRPGRGAMVFEKAAHLDGVDSPEGYQLDVSPREVHIRATGAAGLFYGVQTMLQLLPPAIESKTPRNDVWSMPCVKITDTPRFAWRGLLLDVSRHFLPKEFVERYLDEMARYKYNVFHWHLTDDNGWRVEIKSLPKLTQVGAWRVPRLGLWGERQPPQPGEAASDGGFYTQDDIREVVAYARDRFITVMPEIEMPGHSLAAIASYPELSCTGEKYPVNPGSRFYSIEDNALCPGNEKSYEFLDRVLTEIAELFPSPYIHVGGDECYKGFWQVCPRCQKRMSDEHLKNAEELQSYFIKRVEKILASKGKKLIGWDEILEGGLAPSAAVMSWRGMEGGTAAAKMGHEVVMTPSQFVYLDLYQGDPSLEPPTYSMALLSACYRFEPVPPGVDAKYILGGQGNLWTESVPTARHAEYMTWPRAMALSEVFWSPKQARNWNDFVRRMEEQFARLDAAQVNYARSVYDVGITPARDGSGKMTLALSTELEDCDIYYTFDGTMPDQFQAKYPGRPLEVPPGADTIKAIAYRQGHLIGRMLSLKMKDLEDRVGKR